MVTDERIVASADVACAARSPGDRELAAQPQDWAVRGTKFPFVLVEGNAVIRRHLACESIIHTHVRPKEEKKDTKQRRWSQTFIFGFRGPGKKVPAKIFLPGLFFAVRAFFSSYFCVFTFFLFCLMFFFYNILLFSMLVYY